MLGHFRVKKEPTLPTSSAACCHHALSPLCIAVDTMREGTISRQAQTAQVHGSGADVTLRFGRKRRKWRSKARYWDGFHPWTPFWLSYQTENGELLRELKSSAIYFGVKMIRCRKIKMTHLLAVPHTGDLSVPHLLLQLENAKHERLGSRRAARDVDIDRDDPVATPGDGVAVVVVTTAVGTAAHGNDPSRVRHLVVDLTERRRHLVGKRAGHNHHVGLTLTARIA
ncbi:hypothetical protein KC347_g219 [Hortaea werneckii]|nr:hypothetical protein KC347_g219 [Hortaea werneckii]